MPANPKIAVIGLGYVGLPLAVALADKFSVTGLDINENRINELLSGYDKTGEIDSAKLKRSTLKLTTKKADISGFELYIVTVPTPVDDKNKPDLGPVIRASSLVGSVLQSGAIVVYESTVYPGVTEDIAANALEAASNLTCGQDFYLGYSPERINPGDSEHTVERLTKVVAGQTPAVTEILEDVYGAVTTGGVFKANNIRTAEAAKVIENAQRDINIAFVNEVTMICQKMGISVYDVLDAAGTKWNFLSFKPGLVGGHCIGVDPYYLAHVATTFGHNPKVILSGRLTNDSMGNFIADSIASRMPHSGMSARILVLGLTFKADIPDLRNTRVIDVVQKLKASGGIVSVHDSYADPLEAKSLFDLELLNEMPHDSQFDCIVGAVSHKEYIGLTMDDFALILKPGGLVADITGMWRNTRISADFSRWQL